MTNEEAIKELRDASDREVRYGDTNNHYDEVMKRVEAFDMAILALETHPCLSAIIAEREEEKKPKIWCANCKHCEIRYTEERVGHDRGYRPLAKVAYRYCSVGLSCSDARMYCEKYDEKEEKVI